MNIDRSNCRGDHYIVPLIEQVVEWHYERNLIKGATEKDQFVKLSEEFGELAGNVCRGNDIRDDIGDMVVVLINLAERRGYTLAECLLVAWLDIKDRKGKMVDGMYVKESDLKGVNL